MLPRIRSSQSGKASPLAVLLLACLLAVSWFIWSGMFKPMLIGLGTLSIIITVYVAVRIRFFDHVQGMHLFAWRLPVYWFWLLKEIVISSIDVARIVLSPSLPISPRLVRMESEQGLELPQVILGNSVTLSPGTITIDIDEHVLLVHCLSEHAAKQLESGELLRRIRLLEQGHP